MRNAHFSLLNNLKDLNCGHIRKFVTLYIIFCIRFGSKLYRQIVGKHMGTNCSPLVCRFVLLCYERNFMLSLTDNNQADIVESFTSTSIHLDDLLTKHLDDLLNMINP